MSIKNFFIALALAALVVSVIGNIKPAHAKGSGKPLDILAFSPVAHQKAGVARNEPPQKQDDPLYGCMFSDDGTSSVDELMRRIDDCEKSSRPKGMFLLIDE